MSSASTNSTSIGFGSSLRIGYRIYGSVIPFTYITHFPSYDELPYTFDLPAPGTYDIEYTQICPSCSATSYSDAIQTIVTVY